MRPDFDGHLHDLLHDAAREIPPDATVIPALLRRIAAEDHHARSFSMRSLQRFIAPAIASVLVLVLAVTFVTIHGAHGGNSVAIHPTATATATATPAPSASFTPSSITQNGITIQIDQVAANALGISVTYHVTNPVPHPGDSYSIGVPLIIDEANHVHYPITGTSFEYPQGYNGPGYGTLSLAPLSPGPIAPHTVHFIVSQVLIEGVEGSSFKQFIKGTWDFTVHLVPDVSGTAKIQAETETVGGISVTPQSISWYTNSDKAKSGVVVRLAISGLPKVADPIQNPLYFREAPGDCNLPPSLGRGAQYLFLSQAGQQQCADYFTPANNIFDAKNALAMSWVQGFINSDGTVIVDAGFSNVSIASGSSLQLLIKELVVSDSFKDQHFIGPWNFSFTI